MTSLIKKLLQERKVFGTQFIFDGMNYLEVIHTELGQIKDIISTYQQKVEKLQQERALKNMQVMDKSAVI